MTRKQKLVLLSGFVSIMGVGSIVTMNTKPSAELLEAQAERKELDKMDAESAVYQEVYDVKEAEYNAACADLWADEATLIGDTAEARDAARRAAGHYNRYEEFVRLYIDFGLDKYQYDHGAAAKKFLQKWRELHPDQLPKVRH